jgi:hypothetical protein
VAILFLFIYCISMRSRKHKSVYLENSQYHKSLLFLLCLIGSFCMVIDRVQATTGSKNSPIPIDSVCLHEDRQNRVKGTKQICEKSIKYIVKIRGSSDDLLGDFQGSGFIIKKIPDSSQTQQYKYYVLTNKHVIKGMQKEMSILTSDRDAHSVYIDKNNPIQSNQFDIGIVYFVSKKEYQVANPDEKFVSNLGEKESETDIFVVGYPKCKETNCQEPKFTQGKYAHGLRKDLLDTKRLEQGYSIPYNNDTEVGMSGSPIITTSGTVIGIHGQGKYDTSSHYVLENKEPPSPINVKMMKFFSWGISIDLANNIIPSDSKEIQKKGSSSGSSPQPSPPPEGNIFGNVGNLIYIFFFASFLFGLYYCLQLRSKRNNNKDVNTFPINSKSSESIQAKTIAALEENTETMKVHAKVMEEHIVAIRNYQNSPLNMNTGIDRSLKPPKKDEKGN